jgi:hypothetical protein
MYRYHNILRTHGESLEHLKCKKDVVNVSLVVANLRENNSPGNPRSSTSPLTAGANVNLYSMQCPCTRKAFDKNRLVLLKPCGHVLALA